MLAVKVIIVVEQLLNAKVAPLEITAVGKGLIVMTSSALGILEQPLALVAITVYVPDSLGA